MTVEQAVEVLREAGWHVHTSTGRGTVQAGILIGAIVYDPAHRNYSHIMAVSPWVEVVDG